jgi:glutamyl/glutaminyl-tRNA synthetase
VVTVDDALMGITHVIRGDDHISNTPKQVAIYQAFGWPVPQFAHLSTILGADRERLSKRHGATSVSTFRQMGYLPEAVANYLALLGWGAEDGKTETFTLAELVPVFSLERVTPSPAVFDFDKLNWLNRHYIKKADPERIAKLAERQFCIARPDIFPLWSSSELHTVEMMAVLAQQDPPISFGQLSAPLIELRKAWFARRLPSTIFRNSRQRPRSSSASIQRRRARTLRMQQSLQWKRHDPSFLNSPDASEPKPPWSRLKSSRNGWQRSRMRPARRARISTIPSALRLPAITPAQTSTS